MTREQRQRAKVARRRRRNEQMRITPRRVNVRADGSTVLIAGKVRGPRRGHVARALSRAQLARIGQDRMMGIKASQRRERWFLPHAKRPSAPLAPPNPSQRNTGWVKKLKSRWSLTRGRAA